MKSYVLRPAREADSPQIKNLIHKVGINPMSLEWNRFLVVVDAQDQVIGTGQLKPHGSDILELSSIAVEPDRRGQGIARAIIESLLTDSRRPLYLTCVNTLGPLYEKFGFVSLSYKDMPKYFQRLSKLANAVMSFARKGDHLLVMKLQ